MFTLQRINRQAGRRNGWAKPQIPALGMEKPPGQPSAKSQWDFGAQRCKDPPAAAVGKVLRDEAFTSNPALCEKWGNQQTSMGTRNVPKLGMQQVGATPIPEKNRKPFIGIVAPA